MWWTPLRQSFCAHKVIQFRRTRTQQKMARHPSDVWRRRLATLNLRPCMRRWLPAVVQTSTSLQSRTASRAGDCRADTAWGRRRAARLWRSDGTAAVSRRCSDEEGCPSVQRLRSAVEVTRWRFGERAAIGRTPECDSVLPPNEQQYIASSTRDTKLIAEQDELRMTADGAECYI